MNALSPQKKALLTPFKKGGTPIVCLTAYTTPMARLLDPLVDLLLVGDSLGMVLYGFENTLPVTLDMMIAHGAAVERGAHKAPVVVDMPFGTYDKSPDEALRNARRVMRESGCSAVKCEGGQEMAATLHHLRQNGVPVMGHVGLLPQSIKQTGGYKIQGRDEASAQKIIADAKEIAAAGAFALVVEGVVEPLARRVTEVVPIPTIGIGASKACDGQVLVLNDLLGLTEKPPRFAKNYATLAPVITAAVKIYAEDVRARRFPGPEHVYGVK